MTSMPGNACLSVRHHTPIGYRGVFQGEACVGLLRKPMARKDLRQMVEEAARGGQTLAVIPALAALLDEGIARGEGGLDVAAGVRVPG